MVSNHLIGLLNAKGENWSRKKNVWMEIVINSIAHEMLKRKMNQGIPGELTG